MTRILLTVILLAVGLYIGVTSLTAVNANVQTRTATINAILQ